MSKIQASLVLEMLGRPKEHLAEMLKSHVEKMSKEKGVKITNQNIHEPLPVENSDMFTTFAEVDVELDAVESFFFLIFAYMPAHIEIVSPEKMALTNSQFNELAHGLTQRLHQYEALSKKVVVERNMLAQKLHEVAPHLFTNVSDSESKPGPKEETKKKKKSR